MKCIMCRKHRGGINLGMGYVLCSVCGRTYSWSRTGRYLRRRKAAGRWVHQDQLRESVVAVLRGLDDPRRVVTEVGYPDWGISSHGGLLRFDIGIPKYHILVDYHGSQHYTADNYFHRTASDFRRQAENDTLKKELAAINGYQYIVFSYREDVGNTEWVRERISVGDLRELLRSR